MPRLFSSAIPIPLGDGRSAHITFCGLGRIVFRLPADRFGIRDVERYIRGLNAVMEALCRGRLITFWFRRLFEAIAIIFKRKKAYRLRTLSDEGFRLVISTEVGNRSLALTIIELDGDVTSRLSLDEEWLIRVHQANVRYGLLIWRSTLQVILGFIKLALRIQFASTILALIFTPASFYAMYACLGSLRYMLIMPVFFSILACIAYVLRRSLC